MAKLKGNNIFMRIFITFLGVAFILWGIGTLVLGVIGERDTAVITSIRRQGGERNDGKPGRYTYQMGYTFILPSGKKVDGSAIKIGSSIYLKPNGKSTVQVRYLKGMPFINTLEESTKPSLGQLILVAVGTFLILVMKKTQGN